MTEEVESERLSNPLKAIQPQGGRAGLTLGILTRTAQQLWARPCRYRPWEPRQGRLVSLAALQEASAVPSRERPKGPRQKYCRNSPWWQERASPALGWVGGWRVAGGEREVAESRALGQGQDLGSSAAFPRPRPGGPTGRDSLPPPRGAPGSVSRDCGLSPPLWPRKAAKRASSWACACFPGWGLGAAVCFLRGPSTQLPVPDQFILVHGLDTRVGVTRLQTWLRRPVAGRVIIHDGVAYACSAIIGTSTEANEPKVARIRSKHPLRGYNSKRPRPHPCSQSGFQTWAFHLWDRTIHGCWFKVCTMSNSRFCRLRSSSRHSN
uniref:uncharacterized protein LOC132695416 n=1 Tax=Panthera onca TaxID=9690 RepID=UPI002955345A|nr:uncharacterized protein LOC132695416 [Panthera onca]